MKSPRKRSDRDFTSRSLTRDRARRPRNHSFQHLSVERLDARISLSANIGALIPANVDANGLLTTGVLTFTAAGDSNELILGEETINVNGTDYSVLSH